MAIDQFSLVTLDEVKEHFNITDSMSDVILEKMIDRASSHVESYLDRKMLSRSYTEVQDGTRGNTLVLRNFPVTSVTSLRTRSGDQTFNDPLTEIPSSDFSLEQESVIRLFRDRLFPRGVQNVRCVYDAGYRRVDQVGSAPVLPFDLSYATILMVEYFYQVKNDRSINVDSKARNGQTVKLIHGMPQSVVDLLDPHKRIEVAALNLPAGNA